MSLRSLQQAQLKSAHFKVISQARIEASVKAVDCSRVVVESRRRTSSTEGKGASDDYVSSAKLRIWFDG